jgi:hypothetical protein
VSLHGWQAVAMVALGVGCAVAGVWLPHGDALVALGSTIVGGVVGVLQPWRSPNQRTRAADRTPTAGLGVPLFPPSPDPDKTPRDLPRLPPGVLEDRRKGPPR